MRFLLASERGRPLFIFGLTVLGVAFVAFTLTDGFFGASAFRLKLDAFLVFFALGCVVVTAIRLSRRQKDKASSRLD